MKRFVLTFIALVACSGVGAAEELKLATTLEEFQAQHQELGKTPEGAMKLWLNACLVYINEETRAAGKEMIEYLTIEISPGDNWERSTFAFMMRDQPWIFRSYAKGTKKEDGYAMDPNNWDLNVQDITETGWMKLKSSGADTPRPCSCKRKKSDQLWYVSNYHNLYVGVQRPGESEFE